MSGFHWLSRDVVLAAHDASLERFGGTGGIRDEGLLESALARPQMLAHYEPETGPHRLAAAYAFGIAKNHAFVDGNKRTGFLAAYVFLRANGWTFEAEQADVVVWMLGVAAGSISEQQLAEWLARNSTKSELS
jgi:death-on-curing protein